MLVNYHIVCPVLLCDCYPALLLCQFFSTIFLDIAISTHSEYIIHNVLSCTVRLSSAGILHDVTRLNRHSHQFHFYSVQIQNMNLIVQYVA